MRHARSIALVVERELMPSRCRRRLAVVVGAGISLLTHLTNPVDAQPMAAPSVVVSTPIALPAATNGFGPASPYPLEIPVSGVVGTVDVTLRLRGFTHSRPADVGIVLVSPTGVATWLLNDPVSGPVSNLTLTFENGGGPLPATQLVSGRYSPSTTSAGGALPAPAPLSIYGTTLPSPTGAEANGIWQLYAADDFGGESGRIDAVDLIFTVRNGVDGTAIPDNGVAEFPIAIGGISGAIATVTVNFLIFHPATAQLDVSLVGPDGTEAMLASGRGSGANFGQLVCPLNPPCIPSYTWLQDEAIAPISAGANPFTGTFRPDQLLRAFAGKTGAAANGTWRLRVRDRVPGLIGSLYRAELRVRDHGPLGQADAFATAYAAPLVVAAPGVLANDDRQGAAFMQATFVSLPAHGSLNLAGDGSFTYTPFAGFAGADSFLYRPWTAEGYGAATTVTIAVGHPPDPQPPSQLRVESVTGTTVTLRWRPPAIGPAPTGYLLEGGLVAGQTIQTVPVGAAPVLTFAAPRGSFVVRVRTVAGSAVSPPSNEVPLHVEVAVPPSPPVGLTAVVDGSTLALAWRNTYAGGTPTALELVVVGAFEGVVPLALGDTIAFANVPAGEYKIGLRAVNGAGASSATSGIQVIVPAACTGAPSPPTDVLIYRVGQHVYARWDPAPTGAAATGFRLAVTGSFTGGLDVAAREFSAEAPPGAYAISLMAVNGCGVSGATTPVPIVVP
ncbi:MAG: Ig-like domain-containing protein [Vicinamibacterales bacterium]